MRTAARSASLDELAQGKISSAFSARLSRLKPRVKLRAIVLLGGTNASRQVTGGTRQTSAQRRAAIEQTRGVASEALDEIDKILGSFGGRRVSDRPPTALGTVSVESNPAGLLALAASEFVRAILEDQPVSSTR